MTPRYLGCMVSLTVIMLAACGGGSNGGVDAGGFDARSADTGTAPGSDASSADASIDVDAGPVTPHIEIGTGTDAFEPLGPGTTAELVHGPQGGFHVQITFRLWGIDPESLLIQAHGYDADTGDEITIPIERVLTARRVSVEGDHLLRLGDRLIFNTTDPTTISDPATGSSTDLRITALFTPTAGDPVSAETTTTVIDTTP